MAVLMYARVDTEVVTALGGSSAGTAGFLAGAFAVVSLVASQTVVAVRALDGSPLAHRADRLSKVVSSRLGRARDLRRRADVIAHRMVVREQAALEVQRLCLLPRPCGAW